MSPPDDDVPPPSDDDAPTTAAPAKKPGPNIVTVPVDAKGTALSKVDKGLQNFSGWLNVIKPQLAAALPKHVRVDRMLKLALTTLRRNPDLLECTRDSLLGSIVQASQLGLEFDGVLGEAYLIPRNEKQKGGGWLKVCQMLVGYKGLRKLAMNTGLVSTIGARVVHEQDKFRFEYGLNEKLIHKPAMVPTPGPVTYVYAIARLKEGGAMFEVLSRPEIEAIRGRGGNRSFSPWDSDWDEMAKKSGIRRVCKLVPASAEDKLQRAVSLDEAAEAGVKQEFEPIDVTANEQSLLTAGGEQPQAQQEEEKPPAKSLSDVAAANKAKREAAKPSDPDRDAAAPTEAEIAKMGPPPRAK